MRVYSAVRALEHDQGAGHPESPARLAVVLEALSRHDIAVHTAPPASLDAVLAVHDADYVAEAMATCARGGELGPDTLVNPPSWDATLAATGAALGALDYALSGAGHGFAAIRPPGHHALADRAMGFCIVNHAAVLAAAARAAGRGRVLIVDWDVHHGNGTQALVEADRQTRFVSMHQWPWYPGTGSAAERGVGNCFNVPMAPGLPPGVYVESLWRAVHQATSNWVPDVVIISAGYDSMLGDPLGGFTLEPPHFAEWVERLRERLPAVPIVALMEGGYAPARLADGVIATVRALA